MFNMCHKKGHVVLAVLILYLSKSYQTPISPTPVELQKRYGDALEAIFGIGIRLQALLDDPNVSSTGSNFLISPLSVALVVAQLMLGAEGEFREELYNLLSLPESNDSKYTIFYKGKHKNSTYTLPYAKLHLQMSSLVRALEGNEISRSFTLNCTNGLFVKSSSRLRDEFRTFLELYDTQVQSLNFSTDPVGCQRTINNWASEKTNGVIKNILPHPLPPSSSAVFTNAIYFLADWETPFSYETNNIGPFRSTVNKSVTVEYMNGYFEDIGYAESAQLGYTIMAFPYKSEEIAMYFMLPHENGGEEFNIRKFSDNLKSKDVLKLISQMKKQPVSVQMPKMKLSNSISILEPLQRYYLFREEVKRRGSSRDESGDPVDVLENRVDKFALFKSNETVEIWLTKAAVNENLRVNNILQQMTLTVDEKGTEAAAVTATVLDYIGGSKNFKLNRPFVFFIRHELTSAVLFWGTIVDPVQSQ